MKNDFKKVIVRTRLMRMTLAKFYRILMNVQGFIGQQLLAFAPDRVAAIEQDDFSFTMGRKRGLLDSILRAGLIKNAMADEKQNTLGQYHYNFWQGKSGYQYHTNRQNRFDDIFMTHYGYVVDEIAAMVQANSSYATLCEIGSGSGQLLDHLAVTIPEINRLIGVDLSDETTNDNRQQYTNPKLEFVAADGLEWIEKNGQPHWIYLTNSGVLEYFSQKNLEALFQHIARQCAPAIFIAIEPVSVAHDLKTALNSIPYGREFAFSHNYPYLFEQAGFQMNHMSYSYQKIGHYLYVFIATIAQEQ